ncbi:MAG: hypothetical protein HDQ88_11710 [Clostridia bacterium]|nr:hypothetical protein [Clostridia bacterium]
MFEKLNTPIETKACIHSLSGNLDTVIIIKKDNTTNSYLVKYKGLTCTAIFNYFTGKYYVDDIYGIISDN